VVLSRRKVLTTHQHLAPRFELGTAKLYPFFVPPVIFCL